MFCRARLLRAGTVWVFELVEDAHGSGPCPKTRGRVRNQGEDLITCPTDDSMKSVPSRRHLCLCTLIVFVLTGCVSSPNTFIRKRGR